MTGLARLLAAAAILLVPLAGDSTAHTRSASRSDWSIGDAGAGATFSAPLLEVTRLGPVRGPAAAAAFADHVAATVRLVAGDSVCGIDSVPAHARPGYVSARVTFDCAGPPSHVTIRTFFDVASSHTHFARIPTSSGERRELLFVRATPRRALAKPQGAGWTELASIGVEHIATGIDHLAFLAVLLLVPASLTGLAKAVTGFTVGHSISLLAAARGVVAAGGGEVESMIGFTVALTAACAVLGVSAGDRGAGGSRTAGAGAALFTIAIGAASWLLRGQLQPATTVGLALAAYALPAGVLVGRDSGRALWVTAAGFGLIHGLGFAGGLAELGYAQGDLLSAVLGFNLGVEAGQFAIIGAALIAAWALKKTAPSLWARHAGNAAVAAGLCLTAAGTFWFAQRALG